MLDLIDLISEVFEASIETFYLQLYCRLCNYNERSTISSSNAAVGWMKGKSQEKRIKNRENGKKFFSSSKFK